MKVLYKPFALIASFIAARLGRGVFKRLWSKIDRADPPDPTTAEATFPKVVGAAALEAATMAGIAAAVDRSEEHTSELQSRRDLVCRLLLEKKKKKKSKKKSEKINYKIPFDVMYILKREL